MTTRFARGIKVAIVFTRAPAWAAGPGRPSTSEAPPDAWRPNPSDVGDFTKTIATRYSGQFMDLPAVRYWQPWAEPNLRINLGPPSRAPGRRVPGVRVPTWLILSRIEAERNRARASLADYRMARQLNPRSGVLTP